jgi:ABC-2 type transport system ATP-binding protein
MSQAVPVRVVDLCKRYRRQIAVDRLSFEVPAGSVFGLLGENGAGKTTTIQSLLGLVVPDSGSVETLGLNPVKRGLDVRRRVGYVPEQPGLYDWMTVAEIGWFAAGFHAAAPGGVAGCEARYRTIAEGFELPPKRKLKQLSKGMRAKVSLALALAPEPELLILDEPTSGLDVLVRREFLESMVDLAGAGRTVVLSSHQIGEVERVASHVALLHKGKLILAEPLDELKARTFRVTLALSGAGPLASLPLEWIDVDQGPRQVRGLVHADAAALEALHHAPGVTEVDVEQPSLEDIYIAYLKRRIPSEGAPVAVESV